MAQIHTEVYRRFEGELREHPLRFWPIVASGVRVNVKKRLPLLILYGPCLIATVIFSFLVYARFAAEEQLLSEEMEAGVSLREGLELGMQRMVAQSALQMLAVRNQIFEFNQAMSFFALFAVAWYGSGLLCEDRRVGAHQLYFARPLTRFDYFLGKFLTAACFAAMAMLVPCLVICFVASWSSPDWSFLTREWDVILRGVAFALIWIVATCSLTLCASSLFPRRSFALAGLIGFTMILEALSHMLAEMMDRRFLLASPLENLNLVAHVIFQKELQAEIDPQSSWMVLTGVIAAALLVTVRRLRKLEVVG